MTSPEHILLAVAILMFAGILISKAGFKFGMPSLLLFLIAGMLFGNDGVGFEFHDFQIAQALGMVALCVILFSGAIETKFADIKPVLAKGIVLSTLGVFLTTLITGTFVYYLTNWVFPIKDSTFLLCTLLAATMSSTDSAAVFNVLRGQNIRLKNNLQPILELESGSNDPMAYVLTIVIIQIVTQTGGEHSTMQIVGSAFQTFVLQFLIGGFFGVAFGYLTLKFLNLIRFENAPLYAILLLSIVFITYTTTSLLKGNGYLAIYIAGLIIGNNKIHDRKQLVSFFDGLAWLMQILMFLVLGLLVNPKEMFNSVGIAGLVAATFVIFVARPLAVNLSLLPFRDLSLKSKAFLSWVGLRGASPIIFAMYPVLAGVNGSNLIFNAVFFITLISLIVQGTTISKSAVLLGLKEEYTPDEHTFGVEIPEEVGKTFEIELNEAALEKGNTLKEITLPSGCLVMMVKRGEKYMVPNGSLELKKGDRLLMILENENYN